MAPCPFSRRAEPSADAPDWSALERLTDGDTVFLRKLAALFVRTTPPAVERLVQHFEHREWQAMGCAAHFLKSSLGGVGLEQLLPAIHQLEAAGRAAHAPDPGALAPLVEQVRATLARVVEQFRARYLAQ